MHPEQWSRGKFHEVVSQRLAGRKLIAVSNREPFIHKFTETGDIECLRPASGLATAVHPIMAASGGTWIAHGSGSADRAVTDANDRVQVPPDDPAYTLRRVWLTEDQERGYYYGLANEGLWPLCHVAFVRPAFRPSDWEAYKEVNELFARAVLEEANGEPALVFIQDYHFCLLPRILRRLGGENLLIAHFWHIPWPNREVFRVFPWAEELVDGLLGNDVMGFHIRYHCQNFRDTADRVLEARVDNDFSEITRGGRVTRVRPFPISIDFEAHSECAQKPDVTDAITRWHKRLNLPEGVRIAAAIERLDYSKGIPQRLLGAEHFFERHPEWHGRVSFIQIAAPSRSSLEAYQREERDIVEAAERLNSRFGTDVWKPLYLIEKHHSEIEMMALHRLADVFMVNSLHDGMNLVAKEFIASRADCRGVLILSRFTGAFRELPEALGINPFSIDDISSAILTALEMQPSEQEWRMKQMRDHVQYQNVYRWGWKILATLLRLDVPALEGTD
ncbi:MAG TPA: trehalose-6-phosphate synthase [Verrucomicrobiales bacterium]|jgi:trehalose 6-phosphate synthase|nr:trehalose-6-phosphate synthase [Verrucomicrobiales bacterium]